MTTIAIISTIACALFIGGAGGYFAALSRRSRLGVILHTLGAVVLVTVLSGARRDWGPYGRAKSSHPEDRAAWQALTPRERWEFRAVAGAWAFAPGVVAGASGAAIGLRRRAARER